MPSNRDLRINYVYVVRDVLYDVTKLFWKWPFLFKFKFEMSKFKKQVLCGLLQGTFRKRFVKKKSKL